jgi:SGNH domain (fused to AT3 domains)
VVGGTPNLEKEPADFLATRRVTMGTCAVPLDRRTAQRNEEGKLASAKTGVHYIDPVPWFCTKQTCPVVIRDVIVYRDNNHITESFASTLRDSLGRTLRL